MIRNVTETVRVDTIIRTWIIVLFNIRNRAINRATPKMFSRFECDSRAIDRSMGHTFLSSGKGRRRRKKKKEKKRKPPGLCPTCFCGNQWRERRCPSIVIEWFYRGVGRKTSENRRKRRERGKISVLRCERAAKRGRRGEWREGRIFSDTW